MSSEKHTSPNIRLSFYIHRTRSERDFGFLSIASRWFLVQCSQLAPPLSNCYSELVEIELWSQLAIVFWARIYLAVVATGASGAFGFRCESASYGVAARIEVVALVDGATVALLTLVDYSVSAKSSHCQLQLRGYV